MVLKPLGLTFAMIKLPHRSRYDVFFSVTYGTSSQLFFTTKLCLNEKFVTVPAVEALCEFLLLCQSRNFKVVSKSKEILEGTW